MKKSILGIALIILAAASVTRAANKPDLSGNWRIDLTKSDFGGSPAPDSFTRKIEQDEPSLILTDEQTSPLGMNKAVRRYTTDGKEITYHWMGSDVKSSAHWEGNTIVTVGKLNAGGTDVTITSSLTLSADGMTLTESDKVAAGGSDIAALSIIFVKR
jgi:hypothetical protein